MMKKIFTLSILFLMLSASGMLWAYEPKITHSDLSKNAVLKSALNTDATLLPNLGLQPFSQDQTFSSQTITTLFKDGAIKEDDDKRALNHFYDPFYDRALTVLGLFSAGYKSPDWALANVGSIPAQMFSYEDARSYFYKALTANDPAFSADVNETIRKGYWSLVFGDLGHTIHHIQDMAQPQHVRNDAHCDLGFFSCGGIFYNPSRYERYSADEARAKIQGLAASALANAVFPGASEFKSPRDFWKNSAGSGIAEFTNQNFVSQGTNFTSFLGHVGTSKYPLPLPGTPKDYTIDDLYTAEGISTPLGIKLLCSDVSIACMMTMYPTPLTPKASTLSIFDQDMRAKGLYVTYSDGVVTPTYYSDRLFALNRFNFDAAHETLIPKAVAYSAGLINYFFRGKMQISLPSEGVYSLVDGTASGFSTIKLALANASPPGEGMTGGTLVAVAKFHRNTCYVNDIFDALSLSGDETCRGKDEEIVVSVPQPGVTLGTSPTQFRFDFSANPIPINATDLYIQAVYHGKLGSEADAVVVATKDISEPTYFSYHNDSDYIHLGSHVYTRPQVNADPALLALVNPQACVDYTISPPALKPGCLQPFTLNQDWSAGSGGISLYTVSGLPVRGHTRVVLLTDLTPDTLFTDKIGICQPVSDTLRPVETQLNLTTNTFNWSQMTLWRGSYGWEHWSCVVNGDGSPPGAPDDSASVIPYLMDGTAAPIAVHVSF